MAKNYSIQKQPIEEIIREYVDPNWKAPTVVMSDKENVHMHGTTVQSEFNQSDH